MTDEVMRDDFYLSKMHVVLCKSIFICIFVSHSALLRARLCVDADQFVDKHTKY